MSSLKLLIQRRKFVGMDRFMVHLKNTKFSPGDSGKLLTEARSSATGLDAIIRDCRVSSRYIEFDVSIQKAKINELVQRLQHLSELDHARHLVEEHMEKDDAIKMGVFYFNQERFWEAHEVFEGVWKKSLEGEKDLVQGIILVAAALVHHQKAEDAICLSVLNRALDKLGRSGGTYHGIDIETLKSKISYMLKAGRVNLFNI